MGYSQTTASHAVLQVPPVVADLQVLFGSLDDAPLVAALQGPVRRGPKGHSSKILWRCYVAKYRMGLASTDTLIRALHDNPFLAKVCGIEAPDAIPHKSTFSRFFAKLSKRAYLHLVKDVSRSLVNRSFDTRPGFGQRVALDSTTLKAWSNGGKMRKADKEAGWSVKRGTQGKNEFTYGWKLHLLVDAEYELPIAAHVSAGNVHDAKRASNVLSEAQFTRHGKFRPHFVMADKGYSGKPIQDLVRCYWAKPIIDVNAAHEKLARRTAKRRATPEFAALYKQRTAVERVFSRLKGQRALNRITVRSLAKVTVHCYLALVASFPLLSMSPEEHYVHAPKES